MVIKLEKAVAIRIKFYVEWNLSKLYILIVTLEYEKLFQINIMERHV